MAAVLLALGVRKGDRVLIYMPMIAEAAFAMLACARIGAIHSVVFGGFASVSLASRIEDAAPARDRQRRRRLARRQGRRRTSRCWTRPSACPRTSPRPCCWSTAAWRPWSGSPAATTTGRRCASGTWTPQVPCEWLDATDISYTIYTSGTTGKPKGVQRDVGGYAVALAASMKHIFQGRAGRNLLLHQRHRLGGGPQLHRLRAADRRHGDHHVRGPADPAGRRHLVEPGREVQGHARCSARRRRCACSRSRTRPS